MKEIRVHKAGPYHSKEIESLVIRIEETLLDRHWSARVEQVTEDYIRDAKILADALLETLPGGTMDQLLCELLKRRASLFQVPFFEKEKESEK